MDRSLLFALCLVALCAVAWSADCPPRVRVSWHTLTAAEKQLYYDGVKALKKSGAYDKLARIHWEKSNADWAHGAYGFFPWHREFTWQFENLIRNLGGQWACYNLPFWDWERDAGREQSSVIVSDFGGVKSGCITTGPFAGWTDFNGDCVKRQFDKTIFFVGEARTVDIITSSTSYGTTSGFRANIEGAPHASVHNFFGGHMGSMMSASDPVFFIVHANVDRLWYLWGDCQGFLNKKVTRAKFPSDVTEIMPFNWKFSRSSLFPSKSISQLLDIDNPPLPYTIHADDHLAKLANTLLPGKCKWTHFTSANTNVKRSVEGVMKEHHHFPETKYGFSDPRVDAAYEKICNYYKKARKSDVYVEDYVNPEFKDTVIEECNICTEKGSYRHATPEWIVMNGMQQSKDAFKPICIEIEEYEQYQGDHQNEGDSYEQVAQEYQEPQDYQQAEPAKKDYQQEKPATKGHKQHEQTYKHETEDNKYNQGLFEKIFKVDEDEDVDYDDYERHHHHGYHQEEDYEHDDYGYGYEHDDDYGYGYEHDDDYGYEHDDDYGYEQDDEYGYGHDDYGYEHDDDYGYEHDDDYGYEHDDDYGYEHDDDYGYEHDDDYGYGYEHDDDYGYEHDDDYGYEHDDDYGYEHDDDYGYEHSDDYGYGYDHHSDYGYGDEDDYSEHKPEAHSRYH